MLVSPTMPSTSSPEDSSEKEEYPKSEAIFSSTWFRRTNSVWKDGPRCFLKVLDIPLTGVHGSCVAETTIVDELEVTLSSVPSLAPNTMRVYVADMPDSSLLDSHLPEFPMLKKEFEDYR